MFEESPASALIKSEEPCRLFALDRRQFLGIAERFPRMIDIIRKNMVEIREKRFTPQPAAPASDSLSDPA